MSYLLNRKKGPEGWLLFFYSVPAKPVSNRMKIWRRLSRAGAVQLKGAVYILPISEDHHEFFQWLVSEVESMGGGAAFSSVNAIDSMKDAEIIELFKSEISSEYLAIEKNIDDIETMLNSHKKGSKTGNIKTLQDQLFRNSKSFEDIRRRDFFSSANGTAIGSKIQSIISLIGTVTGKAVAERPTRIYSRKLSEYQGRIWASRSRPFVDRMASAWLIRRFIDKNAVFELLSEKELASINKDRVTFDVTDGDFTHVGDLCTFETIARSFGLKNRVLRKISEIVHELDIRDDRYRNPEAAGIEQILIGLKKSEQNDMELLKKGMSVFEMLYLSIGGTSS